MKESLENIGDKNKVCVGLRLGFFVRGIFMFSGEEGCEDAFLSNPWSTRKQICHWWAHGLDSICQVGLLRPIRRDQSVEIYGLHLTKFSVENMGEAIHKVYMIK